jgi:hypothetical protein
MYQLASEGVKLKMTSYGTDSQKRVTIILRITKELLNLGTLASIKCYNQYHEQTLLQL